MKIAVVVSEFNEIVTERLLAGAEKFFRDESVPYDVFRVPGSFELPVTAKVLLKKGYDAVLVLGCVVKGETYHFDFVAKGVTEGVMRVSVETGKPVIFGVLTVENLSQALERAGGKHGNKGYEWAKNTLRMAKLIKKLSS